MSKRKKASSSTTHWNYRVYRETVKTPSGESEDIFSIREAYYTKKRAPHMHSANPETVSAESIDGLRWILTEMLKALDKKVLKVKTSKK